jgi:hypothetical protein
LVPFLLAYCFHFPLLSPLSSLLSPSSLTPGKNGFEKAPKWRSKIAKAMMDKYQHEEDEAEDEDDEYA